MNFRDELVEAVREALWLGLVILAAAGFVGVVVIVILGVMGVLG